MSKRGLVNKIISSEGIVYGGFDESNHGQFPEYFSLVLSGNSKDSIKSEKIGKALSVSNLRNIFNKVSRRGHSFLQARKVDYENIVPNRFIGYIIASLSEDFLPPNLDTFHLFIDGKLESSKRLYTRDLLSDIYDLSKNQIQINAGGKYDKKYPIVNMADGIARYYFRKRFSALELSKNPHYRNLQYFD